MTNKQVTIALLQHSCTSNKEENIQKVTGMIREAAQKGAQMICLQELFTNVYFPQTINSDYYHLAEPVPGPTTDVMQELAKELGVVIIVSLYEKAMRGLYFNTVAVLDADGAYLGKYRKHHIPEGPQYIEKYYFAQGDGGYPVFDTTFGKIGVLICWDEWFPEPSRILSLKGAEIIFYPSAIGSEPDYPELDTSSAWVDAIKAHGIHNGIFIAAVNRVGKEVSSEGDMTFYGHSFISGPLGKMISQAESENDEIIMATLDMNEINQARHLLQFHRDRRPDSYKEILNMSL
ncbi:carbon-nitrogen hydrolase [Terrilactibacillus laevilacticus]|uniref:carbon-nitrogen hydrolase n=1 Tax=Terrilactibacillus laevilacticus TaxID=1380157 RepID=UPI0011469A33|nr:carbon-nitrogen hydrolase [Terrilactibacillus laevilacticus]